MLELMREVYDCVCANTDSFELDDMIGPDLAYLLGAVLRGRKSGCQWPADRPIVTLLRQHFQADHDVWTFITIE